MPDDDGQLVARARAWRDDDPDPTTQTEVDRLLEAGDTAGLRERFGARLEFGTAGLRGALGAGPNRMNRALVRRATAGLAAWLVDGAPGFGPGVAGQRTVVIGRDGRHGSAEFAADAAAVLAGAGLRPLLFEGTTPTPVVAYATRHLGAAAGIVVTASHNPPADNGYKVYAGDGAQIVPPMDTEISTRIDAVPSVLGLPFDAAGVSAADAGLVDAYVDGAVALSVSDRRDVRIAYTAMHGVGRPVLERVLAAAGFPAPAVVAAQADPDPDFPTVPFPNPEEPGAMDLLLALAAAEGADVAIANDPDADRLAVALPDPAAPGGWRALSGDEIGAILGSWRLEHDGTGPDRLVATTIVSSSLLGRIAADHGVTYVETLTGFKWLARASLARPRLRPVYGYEEALGSCVGGLVKDKDGIAAAMAFAELVAAEKAAGRSPWDRLDDLYRQHGVHRTVQRSIRYEGSDALARASAVVDRLVAAPPSALAGRAVVGIDDLRGGFEELPPSDVVRLRLDGARVIVRPSGTEPKLKSYVEVVAPVGAGPSALDAAKGTASADLAALADAVSALLEA